MRPRRTPSNATRVHPRRHLAYGPVDSFRPVVLLAIDGYTVRDDDDDDPVLVRQPADIDVDTWRENYPTTSARSVTSTKSRSGCCRSNC